ncbi:MULTISPECIES: hypothetical protein [unclassified Streptomyces]|uniref:hypothetical protein n=1 Tax=Streptomyces TaxID=1883 RepID=UPI00164ED708|nr:MULTISPECIES: hypothetical protein [unclassified Streptomyces]MCZ4098706.1 hypothetical protein [Streptomyces sp. H39-C1]
MDNFAPASTATHRKLVLVVLGLAALITTMLCAFALPSLHSGPHRIPIGIAGTQQATHGLQQGLGGDTWDVKVYGSASDLTSAVEDQDLVGGLAPHAGGLDVYTATAGAPSATGALTTLAKTLAAEQGTSVSVHDVVPFTADDPRGAGLTAALMPMIFGGIFPALILGGVFPGHRGLRTRLAGAVLFSLVAGAAVAAVLQFATGSIGGGYWLNACGVVLGMTAMSTTILGLQALLGMAGFALGGAMLMLLGNPLSGLATGPHWLPAGWAGFGQLLPPGAAGSLLRTNAYFDGATAGPPALVLTGWIVLGVSLALIADRRGRRAAATRFEPVVVRRSPAADPHPKGAVSPAR